MKTFFSRRSRVARQASATSLLALTLISCADSTPQLPQPPPPEPLQISAQPSRLVFSSVQNLVSAQQTVRLDNPGTTALVIDTLNFTGSDATDFELVAPPALPYTLEPGQSLSVQVRLAAGAQVGVERATLQATGPASIHEAALSGLRAAGIEGDKEPPLAQIVDALGYRLNVGTTALILGTSAAPMGEEVTAPLFQQATAGEVTLRAVARYSPDGPSPYGLFTLKGTVPQRQVLGTLARGSFQTLNPALAQGSRTTFDPGGQTFGIYLAANGSYPSQDTFTLDSLNTGDTKHAVRAYPLRDLNGTLVPNSYLLGVEPSQNGDYQDVVFILENVRPAQ